MALLIRSHNSTLRPLLTLKLPIRPKLSINKTYIRSRPIFLRQALCNLTSGSERKRLQAAESLRMSVDVPRYMKNSTIYRDLKWEPVDVFIRRLATGMFELADHHLASPNRQGIIAAPWYNIISLRAPLGSSLRLPQARPARAGDSDPFGYLSRTASLLQAHRRSSFRRDGEWLRLEAG